MSFFKKIDKVKAALGNVNAMQRLHVDTFTEDKINSIEGEPIAESDDGQLFAGISELGGYQFLETVVVCGVKLKTFNGATLTFFEEAGEFTLKSDTQEIESDFSNVSNRYMSQITFDITEEELKRIQEGGYQKVALVVKKKRLEFLKPQTE